MLKAAAARPAIAAITRNAIVRPRDAELRSVPALASIGSSFASVEDAVRIHRLGSALHLSGADEFHRDLRGGRDGAGRRDDLPAGGLALEALGHVHGVPDDRVFEPAAAADRP